MFNAIAHVQMHGVLIKTLKIERLRKLAVTFVLPFVSINGIS